MTKIDVLLGLQWGDEGKGKIVDMLTPGYDVIARFNGGPNAGHTIEFDGKKHVLHIIPSGIFHPDKTNIIGSGVLSEPHIFQTEIEGLEERGVDATKKLVISKKTHLILPTHRMMDAANEQAKGKGKIGSTLKGIGPAYTDKVARTGLRVGDVLRPSFGSLYATLKEAHLRQARSLGFDTEAFRIDGLGLDEYERLWMQGLDCLRRFRFVDSEYLVNELMADGKRILAEGAQAMMLDIDFGTYPFVTSSSTIAAGVCTGLGVAPSAIGRVFGVTKAYCTRVGSGPFPTELHDDTGKRLCELGHEYGATTGRARRCGWIDLPALRYACMVNGVTDLFVTKPDVMNDFDEVKMCTAYTVDGAETDRIPFEYCTAAVEPRLESFPGWRCSLAGTGEYASLPGALRAYLDEIEKRTGVRVTAVSISPDRRDVLFKHALVQ